MYHLRSARTHKRDCRIFSPLCHIRAWHYHNHNLLHLMMAITTPRLPAGCTQHAAKHAPRMHAYTRARATTTTSHRSAHGDSQNHYTLTIRASRVRLRDVVIVELCILHIEYHCQFVHNTHHKRSIINNANLHILANSRTAERCAKRPRYVGQVFAK